MKQALLILGLTVSFIFAGYDGAHGASTVIQTLGSETPIFQNESEGPWTIQGERMTIRGLKPIRR